MYAYQQQRPERRLHVVEPQIKRQRKRKAVHKPVVKKNPIVEFFRLVVVFSFLSAFIYYVFPLSFERLIQKVFFPDKLPVSTKTEPNMAMKNWTKPVKADLYSIANPITNYLSNDMFNNRLLLTPTIQKTHSEVTTMYHTDEMKELKTQLNALMAEYPMIKPTIYVWEYENGKISKISNTILYHSWNDLGYVLNNYTSSQIHNALEFVSDRISIRWIDFNKIQAKIEFLKNKTRYNRR